MNIVRIASLAVVVLVAAAGCLDICEHITRDSDGRVCVYIKVGLSKAMIDLAQDLNESASDPFEDVDLGQDELVEGLPEGVDASVERIDNDIESGFAITATYPAAVSASLALTAGEGEAPFFPIESERSVRIRFPESEADREQPDEENPFEKGMMQSFKYRLTIGKAFMKTVSRVTVSTADGEREAAFVSLPDLYLVEIPIAVLLGEGGADVTLHR